MIIDSLDKLRALYAHPKPIALKKQITSLDEHCRRFIALSPFVVVSSTSAAHTMDASPRGGAPGFVHVLDERTLLIPDALGNNRLDTMHNIIETGTLGMIFLIPGVDETLRINGSARLSCQPEHLQVFAAEKRPPKLVIELQVQEAYLHCAKSLMRSKLWDASSQVPRSVLPTIGKMVCDQIGIAPPTETQEEMVARYAADL